MSAARDEFAGFEVVEKPKPARRSKAKDEFRGFEEVRAGPAANDGSMVPSGDAHDGDTFRLKDGRNARLFGFDAFEKGQQARSPDGTLIPIGEQSRGALLQFLPGATATVASRPSYGRPVVSLDQSGVDPAISLLRDGQGLAAPKYLANSPLLPSYVEAERFARQNGRGAFGNTFATPEAARDGKGEPWAAPQAGTEGDSVAVFWDEPTPFQGYRPEVEQGYLAIAKDLTSTPETMMAYVRENGMNVREADVLKFYEERKTKKVNASEMEYRQLPRATTDLGDGKLGATVRGFADPINMIDEMGAVADTVTGLGGRESIWNSNRRFGDILANNLGQNRDILANDEADYPWWRFGGQMASGVIAPGASIEGLGLNAARTTLRAGGSRFAAKAAAARAVTTRLGTVGGIEGGLAGTGLGETTGERLGGAFIGTVAGGALGVTLGAGSQRLGQWLGRRGRRAASDVEADPASHQFVNGASDTVDADVQDAAIGAVDGAPLPAGVRQSEAPAARSQEAPAQTGGEATDNEIPDRLLGPQPEGAHGRVIDFSSDRLNPSARKSIRERRGLPPTEGPFGPILYKLAGKWREALATMREAGTGEVPGAIKHPELGSIDLIWGNGKFGVSKIEQLHPEVIDDLPAIVARLPVVETPVTTGNGKFVLSDGTHRAVVAPDYEGQTKRWLVTAYERKGTPGDQVSRRDPLAPTGGSAGSGAPTDIVPSGRAGNAATDVADEMPVEANGTSPGALAIHDERFGAGGDGVMFTYREGDNAMHGVARVEGNDLTLDIGGTEPNSYGPSFVRRALRSLQERYPEAQRVTGFRTSGARTEAGDVAVPLPQTQAAARVPDRIEVQRPRPLADGPTDAQRLQAAESISPRDVLPIPASRVSDLDEAVGIDAGRIAPVRAPDEMKALESRTIPSPTNGDKTMQKRGPLDLVTWLRTQGGIRAQGGELSHAGIDNTPRAGMDFAGGEGRFGKLVNNEGMTYDEAGERAWEAGFFTERPTPAEFIDALTQTHNGNDRLFRPDDLSEVDNFVRAREERWAVEAAQAEGAPLSVDRSQPVDLADLDANSAPVSAYVEWGENAPDFAGNVRLENLTSPQEIKRALVQTERVAGGFDAATRRRITHAETESLAADLGMTADDLLSRRKGQAFNAEEALAARQILARSATDLVNMAKRVARLDDPGQEAEAAFREAWLRHAAIQEQVAGMTAEAGRLLQQFRQAADAKAVGRVLPSLNDMPGGSARIKDVADRIVDLQEAGVGPGGSNQFAVKSLRARTKDMAIEYYINSLLSGPQTHVVNMLSNTLTALAQIPEHAVAAGVGAVRRGGERAASKITGRAIGNADRVLFSEAGGRFVGLLQGTRDGLREAARALRTGDTSDAVSKVENQAMRAIPGRAGEIIRGPTRLLSAEDELFKGMARRMELTGLAMRKARAEGLSGRRAKERVAELVDNPPDAMMNAAHDYARYLTFQSPLGPVMRNVSAMANSSPAIKFLIPFVRTPANLLKFAIERSPAAPMLKEWRREIAAGGARRDTALARAMVGTGIGAMFYQAALDGQITGGGPADDEARRLMMADGWKPYSVRVGDTYYSYRRLDPFSTTIGTVADMVDLGSHMTDKQREKSTMLVSAAILNNLSSKTWLTGISGISEALADPERNWESFVSRSVGAIAVPALVNQIASVSDPILREARSPLDRIRSRVPGLSNDLFPRRDAFGNPVVNEGGLGPDIVSPIFTGTAKNDSTIAALLKAGAHVTAPRRVIGQRELTPAEYDRFSAAVGSIAKPRLDELVKSPDWKASDDEQRRELVRKTMKGAREDAKQVIEP